jgi:excisionase family DNA binding protein
MPKTYTVKEVADILGFSTNSIYAFLKEKRIRGVRIGKGRFRIPEEELSRILHLSKKTTPVNEVSVVPSAIVTADSSLVQTPMQAGDAAFIVSKNQGSTNEENLLMPNIFDWFIGLGAMVAGVAMFVFNSSFDAREIPRMIIIYPIIRIVLMATGLGIIISSMFGKARNWLTLFKTILVIMGFINAFGLIKSGDIEGGLLYGLLAFIGGITQIVPLGGIVSVAMYASLIALLYPAVILLFPADSHIQAMVATVRLSPTIFGIATLFFSLLSVISLWIGYTGNRALFILSTAILATCDILLAVWYGNLQYWSRAFFLVNLGTFTALLPYWWPLQLTVARRYKLSLHALFGIIGAVLMLAILVVYLLQQNIWMSKEREIMNKTHLGHSRLTNAAQSVTSTLTVAASNADFVDALIKEDIAKLNTYSKVVYESNPNIRRLVFLDKDAFGVAVYPYGTFDEPNFAYRDYFQKAKATGKPYISDVFQAKTDMSGRYVVVVAVPFFDKKNTFAGIMSASIDLERLGVNLAQIASGELGEYFVVVDTNGVILSHPNAKLIGTVIASDDPIRSALQGKDGIVQGMTAEKIAGLIGYAYVPELRWAVSLQVPSTRVFGLTSSAIWIVFGVVSAIMIAAILLISYLRSHIYRQKESGP